MATIESKRLELRSREIIGSIEDENTGIEGTIRRTQDLLDLESERAKLITLNSNLSQQRLSQELTSIDRLSEIQKRLGADDLGGTERRALVKESEALVQSLQLADTETSTLIKARFELETRIAKLKNDQAIADINAEQRKLELARQRAKTEANIARNQLEVESIRAQRSSFEATNARIELERDPEARPEEIENAKEAERLSQKLVQSILDRRPAITENLQNELKELDVLEQQLNVQRQIIQEREQANSQTRRFATTQELSKVEDQAEDQGGSRRDDRRRRLTSRRIERLQQRQEERPLDSRQRLIDRLQSRLEGPGEARRAITQARVAGARQLVQSGQQSAGRQSQQLNVNAIVEGLRKVENAVKRKGNPRVQVNVDGTRATEQQVTQSEIPDSLSILENA